MIPELVPAVALAYLLCYSAAYVAKGGQIVMAKRKPAPLKPLKNFDFELVRARLDGLLLNTDRDFQRRVDSAVRTHHPFSVAVRQFIVLNMAVRFGKNSYSAV